MTKSPDQATYTSGTVVSLTAVPAAGWSFSGWSGDLSGSTNPASFTDVLVISLLLLLSLRIRSVFFDCFYCWFWFVD